MSDIMPIFDKRPILITAPSYDSVAACEAGVSEIRVDGIYSEGVDKLSAPKDA